MGGIIGGLLLSLLVAWVAYRVSRKSQLVATINFTVMMGLACLTVMARPGLQRSTNQVVTPPAALPAVTSFGGFQFEIPAGWTRVEPDGDKTRAMLLLNGTAWNTAEGMLKVDVGKPVLPTARQTAQSFAGTDGRVFPTPVSLDGIEGIRVETPSSDMSRPHVAVVVFRDERVYLIMAAAVKGADISKAFDQVIKTWRWNNPG